MKREIPLIITFIAGIAFIIQYFIPHWPFNIFENLFSDWFAIVQAFAIWLGALNLLRISLEKISHKKRDWHLAAIIIISYFIVVVVGAINGVQGLGNDPATSFRDPGTGFDWLYTYVYSPLASTMFAMLAFFVASASYRAFRARNLQATLLLLAGFFVMLGRVPVGDWITQFMPQQYQMSQWANWIMTFPQTGGQRAIMIGIALGIVSTSLRIILGIERSHLEGE